VEEVIGVALWTYWEEQEKGEREPRLEVDEEKAERGEETVNWNLRIVEEDGEVDEDFPGEHTPLSILSSLEIDGVSASCST